jgi:hypothetical protein
MDNIPLHQTPRSIGILIQYRGGAGGLEVQRRDQQMVRKISEPEKRAQRLFDRFGLYEIHRNDGTKNPKII